MNHTSLSLVSIAAAAAFATAPTCPAQGVAPGFRLYGPHNTTATYLLDTNNVIVHAWAGGAPPGNGMYLEPDGTLLRSEQAPGRPQIGGQGGQLKRIAFDSTVLWDYQANSATWWQHHDVALLPNGNVLMIVHDLLTNVEAVAAGRDPAFVTNNWLPDAIMEVRQTGPTSGDIVWEWHLMDHVVQDFDATKANFGNVAATIGKLDINFPPNTLRPAGNWTHCNSIAYDPVNDLILLNSQQTSEFYLIDHSTTTAEAAGSTGGNFGVGGDFVYRWGNPQAYRAGTGADQKLFNQHGTYIIPQGLPGAGNVLCFNNRGGTPLGGTYSTVVEIDIPSSFATPPAPGTPWGPTDFVWEYTDPVDPTNLFSGGLSNAERLPNGNTLVCSGRQCGGWLFEIDPAGNTVWQHCNTLPPGPNLPIVFQVSYYERNLWADSERISASVGGTVNFDIVAGSTYSSDTFLVLGSASGTMPGFAFGGVNIPLNVDGYLAATAQLAGIGSFAGFVGTLDPLGCGSASIFLPPLPALAGTTLHHSVCVIDGSNLALASNPVPLTFDP